MPANDHEIQEWTEAIGRLVPEAKVVGVIREGKGLLLHVERGEINADDMRNMERALLRAGADGWTWHIGPAGARIRVHMAGKRAWTWPVLGLLLLASIAIYFYDIHSQ